MFIWLVYLGKTGRIWKIIFTLLSSFFSKVFISKNSTPFSRIILEIISSRLLIVSFENKTSLFNNKFIWSLIKLMVVWFRIFLLSSIFISER